MKRSPIRLDMGFLQHHLNGMQQSLSCLLYNKSVLANLIVITAQLNHLGIPDNGGQRRFQLMRGIIKKLMKLFFLFVQTCYVLIQPLAHVIKRLSQLLYLIIAVKDHPLVQVPLLDRGNLLAKFIHRCNQPAKQKPQKK